LDLIIDLFQEYGSYFPVLCSATSSVFNLFHSKISREKLFSNIFELPCPDKHVRQSIIETWVEEHLYHHPVSPSFKTTLSELASHMDGYQISDILSVLQRSWLHVITAKTTLEDQLLVEILHKEMKLYIPSHLRDHHISKVTDVRLIDVGGLHNVKRELTEILDWPTRYTRLFKLCKLRWSTGLLLYGPPGCGKTLIARAIAAESGLNCFSVKGPELLNKYVGASEQAVRDVFLRARMAAPSIILFDEFDAIASQRGHDTTGVTDRVVNQLLTELDGVESLQGVFILATSTRPDLLDLALLRPGRLDKLLFCDFPSRQDRMEILQILCSRLGSVDETFLDRLADQTNFYSGADLEALVSDSRLEAIHDVLNSMTLSIPKYLNGDDNESNYLDDSSSEEDNVSCWYCNDSS
jgi:peroxin-1